MRSPNGFTLLELSIVLVIIGLVAGGILAGRELIKMAEIRGQVSELQKYDTAVTTFRLKYNAMPGDMLNPSDFGLTGMKSIGDMWNAGFPDGNGNQILEDASGAYPPTGIDWSEHYVFFIQLGDANLINGKYKWASNHYLVGEQYPRLKLESNGGIYPFTRSNGNLAYYLGVVPGPTTDTTHFGSNGIGVLSPGDAKLLDDKMDDGVPNRGRVFASNGPDVVDSNLTSCLNDTGTMYNATATAKLCRLTATSSGN